MKFLLKKLWWLILIVAIVVIAAFFYSGKSKAPQYEYTTEKVKRGNIIQTVEATGTNEPFAAVDLQFNFAGTLLEKKIDIGTRVKKGAELLLLDDRESKFQLDQAAANLAQAKANLNQILAGASQAEINVSEKSAQKALVDLENAKTNFNAIQLQQDKDTITYQETYNKAQEDYQSAEQNLTDTKEAQEQNLLNLYSTSVINMDKALADCNIAMDEVYKIVNDYNNEQYIGSRSPQAVNDEKTSRQEAEFSINNAKISLGQTKTNINDNSINVAINDVNEALDKTFEELLNMYEVLINSTTTFHFPDASLNAYKTGISAQQSIISSDQASLQTIQQNILNAKLALDSQINSAQANATSAKNNMDIAQANLDLAQAGQNTQINSAESQINSAQAAYELALAQLNLKKTTPRAVDVAPYQAQVQQLTAAYELAEKKWQDNVLKAPMDGIVTDIYFNVGEQTNISQPVLSMMTINDFEIKVDISESDIAKLSEGNKVEITFDAFGDEEKFDGQVTFINPAQTVIQEVIYYEVTINFDKREFEIKPGMTANVTIFTDERSDVLYIPRRSVIEQDGKKIVRVLENGQPVEYEMITGLKADNGLIEIISGLQEGQEVITFVKEL